MASNSADFSHFISLPLAIHEELVEKATDFQNTVLREASFTDERKSDSKLVEDYVDNEDAEGIPKGADVAGKVDLYKKGLHIRTELCARSTKSNKSSADNGIDNSIFLNPKKLHITVLMLKLHQKDRITSATEVLQKIQTEVMDALGNRPISIRLKGLACMRGSPAEAHVLYAPVEEISGEGRLKRACQVIIDAYREAGLVPMEDTLRKLKLHATLMNTKQRKRNVNEKMHRPKPFDATDIFKKYGSMEWGEYVLQEVHLSQRSLYDENGYYHCCGSIPLPERIVS